MSSGGALVCAISANSVTITALLFDLDNTLIDFMRMKRLGSDAAARAMIRAGADFPFDLQEAGDILFGAYREDIEGNEVFSKFVAENDKGVPGNRHERIVAAAVNAYLQVKVNHLDPYPTVRPTLLELTRRGYKLGILTDAPRFKAYQRLDAAGLTDFFMAITTSTDSGVQKPDARAFSYALEQIGSSAGETVMVGDWPERDMAGGRAAGLRTAWAGYGSTLMEKPSDADHVLSQFSDILKITALY